MRTIASQISFNRVIGFLPTPVQRLAYAVLHRSRDPEPETYSNSTSTRSAVDLQVASWGWLPLITMSGALGLLSVAYAFTVSRLGETAQTTFFFIGLLFIFVPSVMRLLSPATPRFERIGLLCGVGIYCYLVKVMCSPLYFSMFDEFLHWQTVNDIVSSGHLFTVNMLLPVSPYYPGLEIITDALSSISGLSTFNSGLIVIGGARLLMILSLFLLNEQILKSDRIASIATILYMCNPHFLLFDAQFGYESLALPLATFLLFVMAPHQTTSVRLARLEPIAPLVMFANRHRKELGNELLCMMLAALLVVIAIVFTHHVTDFFFDGILVIWTIVYACMRLTPIHRSNLAKTALLAVVISVASIFRPGNPLVGYLSSFLGEAFSELEHVITGTGAARQLFGTYAGPPTPVWERVMTISSMALILLGLPFGLLCLWQRYRSNALIYTFGFVALGYPVSQVFRFTNTGSELADRVAAFLFIPVALVLAIFIAQFWPTRRLSWRPISFITCAITVIFLGGVILGLGPASALLPGPYEVVADIRSIEPNGIQTALWASSNLGPNNRMTADRINQILMGTYGNQRIISTVGDSIDLSPVFLSLHLGSDEIDLLRRAKVRYLVVDLRLTQARPLLGFYYEQGEPGAFHHLTPIDPRAFAKFTTQPQINRVFDSGDIVIYDVGGLVNAP